MGEVGCTGPGLEPPHEQGNASAGTAAVPTAGAMAGMAGASGAGGDTTNDAGSTDGFGNSGTGGEVCSGCAGASGMMAAGGSSGGGSGGGGGGGAGGMSGAGAMTDADAGAVSPPAFECETGGDIVELDVASDVGGDAGAASCVITLPEAALSHAPTDLSLTITTFEGDTTDTTAIAAGDIWPMCNLPTGSDFFYPVSIAAPTQIELCPDACERAMTENAVIKLVYGCTVAFTNASTNDLPNDLPNDAP